MAKGNDQEITSPPVKNDKVIRRGEMPDSQQASGWQFPPRPGYDVTGDNIPIKEVGDMGDAIYPGGLSDADMGMDLSPSATNSMGRPAGRTDSDPHNASGWEHPPLAEKPVGSTSAAVIVDRVAMTGCDSDPMFDRLPNSRLGKHDNMPADEK